MSGPTEPPVADDPGGAEPAAEDRGSAAADLDGPRRRARREREERRAAQSRARAIEQARREAKRRARGRPVDEAEPGRRGAVRGLKVLLWTTLAAVVMVGLGLVLYFTPVMSVRNIAVTGITAVTREEVLAAAQVQPGRPLLQVDTDRVANRVAEAILRVASVRVQRQYPSTLRITIVERVAVAVKDIDGASHLYDRDGVAFAVAAPATALPYLDVDNASPTDPATKAALQVLTSLEPEIAGQVARVAAPSVASVTLTLVDGRTVIWGSTERTAEKAEKLGALLTRPGQIYDVSSPDLPTVR